MFWESDGELEPVPDFSRQLASNDVAKDVLFDPAVEKICALGQDVNVVSNRHADSRVDHDVGARRPPESRVEHVRPACFVAVTDIARRKPSRLTDVRKQRALISRRAI